MCMHVCYSQRSVCEDGSFLPLHANSRKLTQVSWLAQKAPKFTVKIKHCLGMRGHTYNLKIYEVGRGGPRQVQSSLHKATQQGPVSKNTYENIYE